MNNLDLALDHRNYQIVDVNHHHQNLQAALAAWHWLFTNKPHQEVGVILQNKQGTDDQKICSFLASQGDTSLALAVIKKTPNSQNQSQNNTNHLNNSSAKSRLILFNPRWKQFTKGFFQFFHC
jgi:hypothetical protein